jgi:hypothetical protein
MDKVGRPQQQGYEDKDFLKKAICNSEHFNISKRKSVGNMGDTKIQLDLQIN